MTARAKMDAWEKREELFRSAGYYCETCGGPILAHGTPQAAHRIAQTKTNLKRYGEAIIHHRLNLAAVCSLKCNDAVNIGFNPGEINELLERISNE